MARKKEVKFDITAKDKTKAAFSSATSSLKKLKGVAGSLKVPALAGAAVIGGLALFAKNAIKVADTLAKTADQIGISTTALQEYRFASELAGVAAGALDTSFRKFTRTLGELRAGTGAAVTFLKKFKPELVNQFRATKDADAALELLFDSLSNVTNQSDRAALAAAFFGRKGAELTLLVKGGSAALKEQRQRAQDLGLVLEEDLLRAAERTNDQLTILAETIGTNVNRAILQLTPQLGDLAERFAESIPTIVEWVDEFGQFLGLIEKSRFDQLAELRTEIAKTETSLDGFFTKMLEFDIFGHDGPLKQKLQKLQADRSELEAAIFYNDKRSAKTFGVTPVKGGSDDPLVDKSAAEQAEKQAKKDKAARAARKLAIEEERILTAALVVEMNDWLAAENATIEKREQASQQIRDQNATVEQTLKSMREENLLIKLTKDGRTDLAATLRAEMQLRDQIGRELLPAERAELEKLVLEQEKLSKTIDQSADKWREFGELGSDAILSLEGGFDGLADFALRNLDTIIEKMLELNGLAGGSGGNWLDGLFNAGASIFGGLGGQMSAGSSNFLPVNTGGFQFPQFGGGGSFMVGGRGGTDNNLVSFKATDNERVTIETPAQVRSRLKSGSSITNQYIIDARGADQAGLARLEKTIFQLNGSIEKRAIAAVADGVARNQIPGLS